MNKYKLTVLLAVFTIGTSNSLLAQTDPCGCLARLKACVVAGIYPIASCQAQGQACANGCGVCVLPSLKSTRKAS